MINVLKTKQDAKGWMEWFGQNWFDQSNCDTI